MERAYIPETIEELTPEWLTEALRSRKILGEGRITSVEHEILGAGEGFMGVVARLTPQYEGDAGDAPTTLVAKLPTSVALNRVMGELMAVYWREIRFYEDYSEDVGVRTPRLYFSQFDPDPTRETQDGMVKILDRLPLFVVNLLMAMAKRIAVRRGHRYVLLIEDLAPAEPGDQVAGASAADCAKVLSQAARLHAQFWEQRDCLEPAWIARQDVTPRIRYRMFLDGLKGFRKRYPEVLADGLSVQLEWLQKNGLEVSRRMHTDAPRTLIHCDFRFDNVFFHCDPDGTRHDVILGDWQLVGSGAAAYDVAYLLSGALLPETSHEDELQLLQQYHAELVAYGVKDYPLDAFLRDYKRGLFLVLQVLSSTDSMNLGDDRGVDLIDLWVERTHARLRHIEIDSVL